MKKILKKNQIIVTALAVLIAVAGYLNYTDNLSKKEKTKEANNNTYDSVYSQDNLSDENGGKRRWKTGRYLWKRIRGMM